MIVTLDLSSFGIEDLKSLHTEFLNNTSVSYEKFALVEDELSKKQREPRKPKFQRYSVYGNFTAIVNGESEDDAVERVHGLFDQIPDKFPINPGKFKATFLRELSSEELSRQENEPF